MGWYQNPSQLRVLSPRLRGRPGRALASRLRALSPRNPGRIRARSVLLPWACFGTDPWPDHGTLLPWPGDRAIHPVVLGVASDPSRGYAVLVVKPPCEDAGWRAYIQAIDRLQAEVLPAMKPVLIQVLDRGMDTPSPKVRREMAALRMRIRADAINAVVAEDPAIRLMQTALDWLRRPHYQSSNHPTFSPAVAHVEKLLGQPAPQFHELYRKARLDLR